MKKGKNKMAHSPRNFIKCHCGRVASAYIAFLLISLIFQTNPLYASDADKLNDAIYLHNKTVLDNNRDKYGARYQPEDYVIDKNSYRSAFVDLNGDNLLDAIVLFEDAESCGTGGCNMEIYRGTKTGFEFLSSSTITLPPIKVISERRHGWKTLVVSSGGIGTVLLRYNGSRYPSNPSLQPKAAPSATKSAVIVLEQKK